MYFSMKNQEYKESLKFHRLNVSLLGNPRSSSNPVRVNEIFISSAFQKSTDLGASWLKNSHTCNKSSLRLRHISSVRRPWSRCEVAVKSPGGLRRNRNAQQAKATEKSLDQSEACQLGLGALSSRTRTPVVLTTMSKPTQSTNVRQTATVVLLLNGSPQSKK